MRVGCTPRGHLALFDACLLLIPLYQNIAQAGSFCNWLGIQKRHAQRGIRKFYRLV